MQCQWVRKGLHEAGKDDMGLKIILKSYSHFLSPQGLIRPLPVVAPGAWGEGAPGRATGSGGLGRLISDDIRGRA